MRTELVRALSAAWQRDPSAGRLVALARCLRSVMVTVNGGTVDRYHSDQWQIEVRCYRDGHVGTAVTSDPTLTGIERAATVAQALVAVAPEPAPRNLPPLDALPDTATDHRDLPPFDVTPMVEAAASEPDVVATAVYSRGQVWLSDADGAGGSYPITEAQLHLRSTRPADDGAQGAALAAQPADINVAAVLGELRAMRAFGALDRARPEWEPSWVMLTPLATAQALSQISPALCRTQPDPADPPVGSTVAAPAVTLLDDPAEGPAARPFDDDGVPTRRTTVIDAGVLRTLLGHGDAGQPSGHAWAGNWHDTARVAPSTLWLASTTTRALTYTNQPGVGLLLTGISGPRRSYLRLDGPSLRLTARGVLIRDGEPVHRVHVALRCTPRELLSAVDSVEPRRSLYRVNGIFGGSHTLLSGLELAQL